MRMILALTTLILLMAGNLLAGSGYDRCIKEELALKTKEKDACSGLSYILNPSGCFATQKALKEYTSSGKCRKIGVAEKVDFNAPASVSAKDAAPVAAGKAASEVTHQEVRREQPRDEIARLKEEISRLKAENEQLRQRCGE